MNPYNSPKDQLLARFRAWERRGRGWDVYPYPVELEPPFRAFASHHIYVPNRGDAGRSPGLLAALFGARGRDNLSVTDVEEFEPEATPSSATALPTELHLLLPHGFDQNKNGVGHFLQCFNVCCRPVSFELIGLSSSVSLQLACSDHDAPHLKRQLQAVAPSVAALDRSGYLADAWYKLAGLPLIVDLGLSVEFMRPLWSGRAAVGADLLTQIVAALGGVEEDELVMVQVLFQPAHHPWAESIMRVVHDNDGRPFFATGPELITLAKQKVAAPLYACRIRLAAKTGSRRRSVELIHTLLSVFSSLGGISGTNELIVLDHDGWDQEAQEADLLVRTSHRLGMIFNEDELAAFVQLPGRDTAHLPLERMRIRTKAAPQGSVGRGLVLGENIHLGERQTVALTQDQRMRHLYVIGASGTGKSTLLLNLIQQDIEAGHGVAVLDPHGDLVDGVLARLPEHRINDVVLIDPADDEYPVGFNVLCAHSELERTLLSSDLVAVFRRLSTSWGDQMNSVFANAILALLESTDGGTLLDLRHFLVDPKFRAAYLATVQDPEIVYYWQKEFPLLKGNPQAPILTRLDVFLRPKLIRNMVSQKSDKLNFRRIMDQGKIVLAKLSHGLIGEENAHLLGALLVSKLHQTALSRQDQDIHVRRDFFLYADEFQHFATPSMASLLSGVRKYRLGLTLAHQELRQLGGRTDEVASAALTNASTRIVFRVGDSDAKHLTDGFANFEARDLQNLGVGEAIARIERADHDFNLSTPDAVSVEELTAGVRQSRVREASRRQFATPVGQLVPEVITPPAPEPEPISDAAPERRKVYVPTISAPTPPALRRMETSVAASPSPGRGGQKHKYLQSLIKQIGEDRGFRVSIEKSVLDGSGSIDVALEREGCTVACEITVTTPTEYEVGNLAKCLEAGFAHVVLVSTEKKALTRARAAATQVLSEEQCARLAFLSPEALPAYLDALPAPTRVETVNGYRVAVEHKVLPGEQQTSRLRAVRDVIARSLKGLEPPK